MYDRTGGRKKPFARGSYVDEVHAVKTDHQKTIQLNEETGGWFLSYLQKEREEVFLPFHLPWHT